MGRELFPLWHWEAVPVKESQAFLRQLFSLWGLPERVRLDNGHPWGSSTDLPPALALWLIGLGIGVIYNPPRTPQKNGVVERFHGLAEPWGEPASCQSVADYQERLDWVVKVQREEYPSIEKKSRREAYPELGIVARPYDPEQEAQTWSLERVKDYLAQGTWRRKVDKVGRISIYRRSLSVGRAYCRQDVLVTFDPAKHEWVVHDQRDHELARHQASELTAEKIANLEVSYRPNKHLTTPNTTSRQAA